MGRKNKEITPELKKVWAKLIYRSIRQDYKSWITDIVRQMEVADGKGDVKAVHRLAGVLQGKWKRGSTNIAKDKDGKILTTEEERLAVFKAFYEVKFASAPTISTDIVSTTIDILPGRDEPPEINLLAPTLKEVEMAVKCLSNEKS